jgi:hypothetical protein
MWEAGPELTYFPAADLDTDAMAAEMARLKRLFAAPALVPESTEPAPGAIADGYREEAPGSADHARAVMRILPDVAFEIDDDG